MVATVALLFALAQTPVGSAPPQSPAALPAAAPPGPVVFVMDGTNPAIKGRLIRLDTSEVVILVGDTERRFDLSKVRRVETRGDSLKNGAIIGAVVGLAGSLLAAQGLSGDGAVSIVLRAAAAYAVIGMGIDASIKERSVLYQAPSTTAAWLPGARRAAITVRLSW